MNHIKATYTKALAILLSFAMLMTGQPVLTESAVTEPQTEAILEEASDGVSLGGEMPDMPDGISLEEESEPGLDEAVDFSDQELSDEPEDTAPETQAPDEGTAPAETPDSKVEPEETPGTNAAPEETPETPGDPTEKPLPETSAEGDETSEAADAAVPPETQPDEPPVDEPEAEPGEDDNPIRAAIESGGYAYLKTIAETKAYSTADMQEHVFTLFPGAVVLAAAYIEQDGGNALEVWFYTADYLFMTAYVSEQDVDSIPLSAEEVDSLAASAAYGLAFTGDEQRILFVADGEAPGAKPVGAGTEPPLAEAEPPVSDESAGPKPEVVEAETAVQPGGFVLVSPQTRAFLGVDDTATDEECGNLNLGVFVSEAAVQVEATEQDGMGRPWYKVRYLYGADDADGSLIWTAYGTVYVLASETQETQEQDFTVTDYAFSELPVSSMRRAARADAPRMQTLSGNTGSFSAGQTKYAYSGHDSEYLQIATLKGYGAIYATPHYVDEHTVYCLEHTMNSPGVRDNATGPYAVVDLNGYEQTPGYSGIIYGEDTMHAIGWVLRHTYPFMALSRYEDSCLEWSRVAGQFAVREVIKQMEGAQYVRDYWDMDSFYRASGQAPKEYLEYARWLAAEGIAHGSITGDISVSNKSVSIANGVCACTVTLTTDADRIRISRSAGTITGNTGGEDGSYYYLNSGDTITVSSPGSGFSLTAESISSEEEEAYFLVGVPDADIQKILIPQRGAPYPMKTITIDADIPYGALAVTKTDASSGALLPGATFELLNGSGTVIGTQITGADGVARFADLEPGTYTIREKSAPEGYLVAVPDTQSVTVAAGASAVATFANQPIQGKIRIVKMDALTGASLSGAGFTITRLSAPASAGGAGVGTSFTLNTDANGEADTGWLAWGRYRVEETGVPDGFIDNHFSTEIDAYENGKTYSVNVPNEPMTGLLSIRKTDRLDGQPIESVQFDVYYDDAYGSGLACTMTTNKSGVAQSQPLRKGRYIVKEHANPTGYVSELVTLNAEVRPDETTSLEADNQPIQGKIRIVKTDGLTGAALSGAEFTITRIAGLPSHNGSGDGETVAVLTTDENGVAESPLLTYGTYRVEETKVPEHYCAYATGKAWKMNFEYYMNREYAYNRDKGKCKCCGKYLSEGVSKHCHHVNNKLPLDQINKVPNLVWLCVACHRMVHNGPIPNRTDPKTVRKILKYRDKLKS